jgi:hypothetical protein
VPRLSGLGPSEAVEITEETSHVTIASARPSECTPRGDDHVVLPYGALANVFVIVWPDRVVGAQHVPRLRRPKREQVEHEQAVTLLALGEADTATNGRVIVDGELPADRIRRAPAPRTLQIAHRHRRIRVTRERLHVVQLRAAVERELQRQVPEIVQRDAVVDLERLRPSSARALRCRPRGSSIIRAETDFTAARWK